MQDAEPVNGEACRPGEGLPCLWEVEVQPGTWSSRSTSGMIFFSSTVSAILVISSACGRWEAAVSACLALSLSHFGYNRNCR